MYFFDRSKAVNRFRSIVQKIEKLDFVQSLYNYYYDQHDNKFGVSDESLAKRNEWVENAVRSRSAEIDSFVYDMSDIDENDYITEIEIE